MSIKDKLTSRKFWMCLAAVFASIATGIAGYSSDSKELAIAGLVCGTVATCIYNVCEAMIDAEAVNKEG